MTDLSEDVEIILEIPVGHVFVESVKPVFTC